jgi:hypothetical protein
MRKKKCVFGAEVGVLILCFLVIYVFVVCLGGWFAGVCVWHVRML